MRKMPMQLKTMTLLVAILFILGVRGRLTIQILDARTVKVNNNVNVTCRDTTKSKAIQFAYQVANTAAYTDIATCSRIIPCSIKDSTKHVAAKDYTNALYDEFTLTLISYSGSFNGNYKCWDLSNTSIDSDPMEMPYKDKLGQPCSLIIGCSVAHSVCTVGGTCECDSDSGYIQYSDYCSAATTTTIPNSSAEQTTPSQSAATYMTEASNTTEAVKTSEASRTSTASSSTLSSSSYKPPNEYDFVIALIIGITIGVPLLLIIPVIALVVYRYRIRNIQKAKVYKSAKHASSQHHEHGGNGQASKAYKRHSDYRHGSGVGAEQYVHQPSQQ